MKFTLSWLKAHLDTDASAAEIAERLTMIGHEVDALIDRAKGLRDFVVAEVIETAPHPNADKLKVCIVDTGARRWHVVCGAPNARAGLKGVFAAAGDYIPGAGITLKAAAIRGVESAGMLLSEREMGLSDEHTGIVELPSEALVGAPAVQAMGLDDPLLDVAVTPNRSDCLGVRGLARDLAATGLGPLKPLDSARVRSRFSCPIGVALDFSEEARSACPYFVGRLIRGLRNRPSPRWLQDRLTAIGLRPISALVDVTNYLTIDLCRPLHAFDAGAVQGDLRVRLARPGERLAALNGREYALDATMTVIADDEGVAALGGVIGGERTACGIETDAVFLESALFDPVRTAATGRALGILSDARFRFERGVDPAFLIPGIEIATRMMLEFCGGDASELVVAGAPPAPAKPVPFRPERVRELVGISVPAEYCIRVFGALGFAVKQTPEAWRVMPPSWRTDIAGEACLVEEVVRLSGYDQIPTMALPHTGTLPKPALKPDQLRRASARRLLAERGLIEAVSLSFLSKAAAEPFGGGQADLTLINPISADLDVMRPSPLPNLIGAAGNNADRGVKDIALFEVGPQYAGTAPAEQTMVAAGVRAGRNHHRHWAEAVRPVDAFDAKADALALLAALGAPADRATLAAEAPEWYHPGRSGTLRLGPKQILAHFGEIHPRVLRRLDVKGCVVGFEVFLDALPQKRAAGKPAFQPSALLPVERDFAFVVDEGVPALAVLEAARKAEPNLIAEVRVFDVFAGGALPTGMKSLAITVVLQPTEKTLTDAEIEAIVAKIVTAVASATGGRLRG